MNVSNPYMKGTRPEGSNLRRLNRVHRIATGKRPKSYGRSTPPRDASNETIPILPGIAAAVRLALQNFISTPPAVPARRDRKGKR